MNARVAAFLRQVLLTHSTANCRVDAVDIVMAEIAFDLLHSSKLP